MTPVFQTVVDRHKGNCLQAAIASLFDLDLSQVPNFILFDQDIWHDVYMHFLWSIGYDYAGTGYPYSHGLDKYESIGGYLIASVPSRSWPDENVSHSVIINLKGQVVHDPNPSKAWWGENVWDTKQLKHWAMIEKRKDHRLWQCSDHEVEISPKEQNE